MANDSFLVTPMGTRYQTEISERMTGVRDYKKALADIRERGVYSDGKDDLVFYSPQEEKLVVASFDQFPKGMLSYFKDWQVRVEGNPDFLLVAVNDEPNEEPTIAKAVLDGPEKEAAAACFDSPLTNEALVRGLEKLHEYFAERGQIAKVRVADKPRERINGTKVLDIEYATDKIPAEVVLSGELPYNRREVKNIFGRPRHKNGYTMPEVERAGARLRDRLRRDGYVVLPETPGLSHMVVDGGKLIVNMSAARIGELKVRGLEEGNAAAVLNELVALFEAKPGDLYNEKWLYEVNEWLKQMWMMINVNEGVKVTLKPMDGGKMSVIFDVSPPKN